MICFGIKYTWCEWYSDIGRLFNVGSLAHEPCHEMKWNVNIFKMHWYHLSVCNVYTENVEIYIVFLYCVMFNVHVCSILRPYGVNVFFLILYVDTQNVLFIGGIYFLCWNQIRICFLIWWFWMNHNKYK